MTRYAVDVLEYDYDDKMFLVEYVVDEVQEVIDLSLFQVRIAESDTYVKGAPKKSGSLGECVWETLFGQV